LTFFNGRFTNSEMTVDKSHLGIVFNSPRATKARQEEALRNAGASWIVTIGGRSVPSWRWPARQVREGDTVYVYAIVCVPSKRGEDEEGSTPTAQIGEFVAEVTSRGGCIVECYTGRNSCDAKQRNAMIREAMAGLRKSGKPLPEMGRGRGRPKKEWSDDQLLKAREVWFSKKYTTNEAAAEHMPEGFGMKRAWMLFGPSGRPFKRKR
jgi:hypothetical protein